MARHNELGKIGEELALEHLISNGYTIVEKNYTFDKAEVDIIAQKGETLVCVEVKTRSSDEFGDPQDSIKSKKIKLLLKAMDHYVIDNDLDVEVRFDVIAIILNNKETKIEHFEDAFFYF